MATRLSKLPTDLKLEICSYLPTRDLMRVATTCKDARAVVFNNRNDWKTRAVAFRMIIESGAGAGHPLEQIQRRLNSSARELRAYERAVIGGANHYHQSSMAFAYIYLLAFIVGPVAEPSFMNEMVDRAGYLAAAGALAGSVGGATTREDFMENRNCALIGALLLCWGIFRVSQSPSDRLLECHGVMFLPAGGWLLVRGLTSYRSISRVVGEIDGRTAILRIRISACSNRLLRSSCCEKVSNKLAAWKRSVTTKLVDPIAGLITAFAGRIVRALPFPDCG